MKTRRNFLASLAGLFALPFVPKAEANPKYKVAVDPQGISDGLDHYSYGLWKKNPDGSIERMTDKEADEIHADFMRPCSRTIWREYPNSGGMIIHTTDPGNIPESFVVAIDYF